MPIGQKSITTDPLITARIVNLEDTINEYEVYENIASGTTGTVTKSAHSAIILDQYENSGDCLIVKTDASGKPIDELARTGAGLAITSTLDIDGNYVLSGIPSVYPVSLIFQIQLSEKYKTAELDLTKVLNETDVTAMNAVISDRTITKEPTGFDSPELVGISYDETTQKITLSGTGWKAYWRGVEVPILTNGWVSTAHTNTTGNIYILYYDGTNFLWSTNTFPGFDKLLIAVAYYRAASKFAIRECHGFQTWQCRQNDHYNIGTYRTAGGDISGLTLSGVVPANRRPDISACTIWDEDLQTINPALTSKAYSQRYLTLTNTINYNLDTADIVPLSTARPYYNPWNGSAFVQTLMPANSVMTVWLYEVPVSLDTISQKTRHVFVQGQSITQATSSSAGALVIARNTEKLKTTQELNLGDSVVISAEYVAIHKFIIQYTNSDWSVTDSIVITGSRAVQVGSVAGAFLTAVTADNTTITGNGTVSDPIKATGLIPLFGTTTNIKIKKLTGTTASTEGGNTEIAHGLTSSKIISVSIVVTQSANSGVINEYTANAGYQCSVDFNGTNIAVTNHPTNSENILSKPFIIIILYEE